MQCHLKSVVKDFLQSSSISETPLQSNTIVAQIELLARAVLWLTGKISRERIPSRLRRLGERRKPRPPTTNFLVLELPERFWRDFEAAIGDIQDLAKKDARSKSTEETILSPGANVPVAPMESAHEQGYICLYFTGCHFGVIRRVYGDRPPVPRSAERYDCMSWHPV